MRAEDFRGRGSPFVVGRRDAERVLDPAAVLGTLTRNALGVGPEQNRHAVAGPLGDLRCGYAAVEPAGQAGVAQVVGAP